MTARRPIFSQATIEQYDNGLAWVTLGYTGGFIVGELIRRRRAARRAARLAQLEEFAAAGAWLADFLSDPSKLDAALRAAGIEPPAPEPCDGPCSGVYDPS